MGHKLVYALAAVLLGVAVYLLVRDTEPVPPPAGRDANGDPLPPWAVARIGRFVASPVRPPFVVSPDGKTVTAAIGDGEIGTVSIATGEVLTRTRVHEPSPGTVQVVDGRFLPSLTRDWSSNEGPVAWIKAISPDGSLVILERDPGVEVLDVTTGTALRKIEVHEAPIAEFTPDGAGVVLGRILPPRPPQMSRGGEIRLIDIATGARGVKVVHPFPRGAALSPDGRRVAVNGWCFLYASTETGEDVLRTAKFGLSRSEVAFAPDGTSFARFESAASKTGPRGETYLVLHDAGDGAERWRVPIGKRAFGIAVSPDATRIAVAGGSLRQFDAVDGRLVTTFVKTRRYYQGVAYTPDGTRLVTTHCGRLISYDTTTGEPAAVVRPPLDPPGAGVSSLAWSDDSKRVATCGLEGGIHVWDASSGGLLSTVRESNPTAKPLHFRSGVPTDEEIPRPASLADHRSVAVSRDGSLFASVGPGRRVIVREVATDAVRDPAKAFTANHVTFSACGRFLAAHDGGPIRVHDVVSGETEFEITAYGGSSHMPLAVSTGGKLVAWAGRTSVVELWSVDRVRLCTRFTGHSGNIEGLEFSPDGTRLASRSADGTVLIWDVTAFE